MLKIHKQLIMTCLLLMAGILTTYAQAPAFPGAEGYGRYTTGGRGGKVIHVTNLNDSGTGSLRAAIATSGARIVVFDVSGNIELASDLKITNDNITIEGQTAPGDGICLKNYTLHINANNVIIRFIRCRMGDEAQNENDAMSASHHDNAAKKNIIIDHCSISWCVDECGSFYGNENFTLQWCMLSESLRYSVHEKGTHGYGGIWGGKNASFHHNLLAHHDSRNPRFDHDYVSSMKGPIDYVNNVVYNWGSNSAYGGESCNTTGEYRQINMVNNYYKPGPYTKTMSSEKQKRIVNPTTKCKNCTGESTGLTNIVPGHFYIAGNYMNGNTTVTNDNWQGVNPDDNSYTSTIKATSRFYASDFTDEGNTISMHSAADAYEKVLSYVGASYKRDAVDTRIVKETTNGTYTYTGSNGSTNGIIDTQSDVGGWPTLNSETAPTDTDGDGMPDAWETENGLDPEDASDAVLYTLDPKSYYTNIEVYCNSLVEEIMKGGVEDASESPYDDFSEETEITDTDSYSSKEGTISWAFKTGASGQTATFADGASGAFSSNAVSLGSAFSYSGTSTLGTVTGTKLKQSAYSSSADDAHTVYFNVTPAEGKLFKPSSMSMVAARNGTDNCKVDLAWINSDGTTTTIATGLTPVRDTSTDKYSTFAYDISNAKSSDGTCGLKVMIYALGTSSSYAKNAILANVVITGDVMTPATGVATGIESIQNATNRTSKNQDTIYNLNGQRVKNPQRGVYIWNGKKVVVK